MSDRGLKRTPWWRYSDQPPSARFLFWVRCVILAVWAVALLFGVPNVVKDASGILASKSSGVVRRQELRNLVVETVIVYVAVPFIVLGIFGFGIVPRRNSAMTGQTRFDVLWRPSRRVRRQTKDGDRN